MQALGNRKNTSSIAAFWSSGTGKRHAWASILSSSTVLRTRLFLTKRADKRRLLTN
jgi:hypothetical protein